MWLMRAANFCSRADLKCVSLICQHCKTTVTLELAKLPELAKRSRDRDDDLILTRECPGCHIAYDSAVGDGLNRLFNAFSILKPVASHIEFSGEEKAVAS